MWPNDSLHPTLLTGRQSVRFGSNRRVSVQHIIDKLTRYASPDLTVVIHLNRLVQFAPSELKIPKLRLSTLWIMAAVAPNQSRWGFGVTSLAMTPGS